MGANPPRRFRHWKLLLAAALLSAVAACAGVAYRHLLLAEWAYLRGAWATAQQQATEHLQRHDESRRALLIVARSARQLDDAITAERTYQMIDPLPVADLRWLAEQYRGNSRTSGKLLQVSKRILSQHPEDAGALLDIARVYRLRKDNVNAKDYASEVVRVAPDRAEAWELLARLHQNDVENDKAAECLRRAVAMNPPDTTNLRLDLADILLTALNDPANAQEQLRLVLAAAPKNGAAHRLLADCYRVQLRLDEAHEHLNAAIRIDSDDVEALIGLAELELRRDRGTALAYAKRVLAVDAGNARARNIETICRQLEQSGQQRIDPAAPNPAAFRKLPPARCRFTDVAAAWGVDFRQQSGEDPNHRYLPESFASGLAMFDYDGDGWLDLYFVNAKHLDPALPDPENPPRNQLYRNVDGTSFEEVLGSGLADTDFGHGVAVGDYNNDGDQDVYLCNYGPNRLFRNNGDGTFSDATATAGVADPGMSTSAAWFDYDEDGDLDLYVCNYAIYDVADPIDCTDPDQGPIYCGPAILPAQRDTLYRNNGDGSFSDVTGAMGIGRDQSRSTLGKGLGVVAAYLDENWRDLEGPWHMDLMVANDTTPNFVFFGDGTGLVDATSESNAAFNHKGATEAGMGIDVGDIDGDGDLDVIVTNQWSEKNTIYRNLGGLFVDAPYDHGMEFGTKQAVGWGTALADFDNDGDLDNFVTNGHFYHWRPAEAYRQHAMLWANRGDGFFDDVSDLAGEYFKTARLGRGAAFGDLDDDGDVDIALNHWGEPAAVLRNDTATEGRWLRLELIGVASNRDAVGAAIRVRVGTRFFSCQRNGGSSYLSAHDPRVHVGLGAAQRVDAVEIRWPSGYVQQLGPLEVNRAYRVVEGQPVRRP